MSAVPQLNIGCYRLALNVRLQHTENGEIVALCDYPLRVVPLTTTVARLLTLCSEAQTCEQLATTMGISPKRIEALCDQLRWRSLLEVGPVAPPTTWPPLSIVIPSYNRAHELARCLRSLFTLSYPHTLIEILVVDDASTDNTPAMLRELVREAEAYGLPLRHVCHTTRQGVATSRNTGAAAATYDLIAYLDSDCVASSNWLTELVPLFQDPHVAAVGGMIRGYERESMLGRYEDTCSSLHMGTRPQRVRLDGPIPYLPTANLLVRRTTWRGVGGFAPLTQGEDVDFCRRVLLTGASIQYLPHGTVYHDYRTTLKAFLAIRVAYASAEATLLQRHPTARRVLILPPEQASFAALTLAAAYALLRGLWIGKQRAGSPYTLVLVGTMITALLTSMWGTRKRLHAIHKQHIRIHPIAVFKATLRGNLAYTYHLCRHLTRYYTLPLLLLGVVFFPFIFLIAAMLCVVLAVDYTRLKPAMNIIAYALCATLNDCAYEVGVVQGCVKYKMWRPLFPVLRI